MWGVSLFLTLQILANEHARGELVAHGIDVALWVPIALFVGFAAATLTFRRIVASTSGATRSLR